MAGKIPQRFIDDLLARVDIVDVINRRVPLKKAGPEYKACCPFHDEKTPSFTVSPTKQFYHCFGCGAHGTAVGFVMDYDRLSFPEAIEALAEHLGLDVPHEAGSDRGPDLAPLYDTLERAARFYARQLRRHPEAGRAVDYLRRRGVSGEIALDFRIGYAPPGWDNLLRDLGRDSAAIDRLRGAGLISEPEGGRRYDRLRDRIVFPILDARGRVVGFGGRVLDGGEPKYLNSPETPVFHKGRELYGLYQARQARQQLDRLLVVEGYMDVVALAQFGIRYAVATLGTATTPEHLEKLYHSVPEVVFCFDGDRAGRDAAWKALETALPLLREGRQARFLFLPEGEDPDTLVRQEGAAAFAERVTRAEPLSEFLFRQLATGVDMQTLDGRARLAEIARPLLARVPAGVYRELLAQRLAELVQIPHLELQSSTPAGRRPARPATERFRPRSLMQQTIALLLQNPAAAAGAAVPDELARIEAPGAVLLRDLLETLRAHPNLPTAALVERWQDDQTRRTLAKLADAPLELQPGCNTGGQLEDALRRLVRQARKAEAAALAARAPSSLSDAEKQRLRELFTQGADESAKGGQLEKFTESG